MPELTVRDVLMRTKRLFTGGQWTQGTMYQHGSVEQFCLIGGLRRSVGVSPHHSPLKSSHPEKHDVYWDAIGVLCATIDGDASRSARRLIRFNDSRNVEDVVELIDDAVARLES